MGFIETNLSQCLRPNCAVHSVILGCCCCCRCYYCGGCCCCCYCMKYFISSYNFKMYSQPIAESTAAIRNILTHEIIDNSVHGTYIVHRTFYTQQQLECLHLTIMSITGRLHQRSRKWKISFDVYISVKRSNRNLKFQSRISIARSFVRSFDRLSVHSPSSLDPTSFISF